MDKVVEDITCKQYTSDITEEIWKEVLPFVEDAAQYSHWEFKARNVLQGLIEGLVQLWTVRDHGELKFVWVTEIQTQVSSKRVVLVTAAAGESKYGWKFWPWMSQWMIGNGIEEAEVYCRPSMARLLRRKGLKTRYEVLTIPPMELL